MIHMKKTDDGFVGWGLVDGDSLFDAFMQVLGMDDDDDELDEEELEDEEECDDTKDEVIENDHVVSVGYNDTDNVVVINYDTPNHPWAVAAALLEAAADMWPRKIDKDAEIAETFREFAAMGRDIGNATLEDDQ